MYQNALREERSEIYVWLYQAVHYLFKPSGSHAHVSESEQLTLNLSVKEPLRRQDAPADCTLNARHSLVPSSCVAGGSLSILNSSLDSSSEPSFPTNAQISVRLDKETMLTFLYWCKQFKKSCISDGSSLTFLHLLDDVIGQGEALLVVWERQDLRLVLRHREMTVSVVMTAFSAACNKHSACVCTSSPAPACRTSFPGGPRWRRRRPAVQCSDWTCLWCRSCGSDGSRLQTETHSMHCIMVTVFSQETH